MSKIIILRGKAATGKTLLSNIISQKLHIPVIRNDDIYDPISKYDIDHKVIKGISYDVMASIVNTNIELGNDLILDISLSHYDYINQFLSKLNRSNVEIVMFLCTCTDSVTWRKRIDERIINPAPNQLFKSSKEAEEYYGKFNMQPLKNEITLDSVENIEVLINKIMEQIESK